MTYDLYLEFVELLKSQTHTWESGVDINTDCKLTGLVQRDQIGLIAAQLTLAEMIRRQTWEAGS